MNWDVGLDFGTEKIRMTEYGQAEFSEAAAALAYREGREMPVMGGNNAKRLEGHTYAGMHIVSPLRDGTIENAFHTRQLLRWSFSKLTNVNQRRKFNALISCQPYARPVQQNALATAAIEAGCASVGLVRADTAAALGAGLDINEPEGKLLLDIGAGHMSATLFSFGNPAAYAYLPYGLNRIDETIRRAVQARYGYRIGLNTAREIKHTLGSAHPEKADGDVIMHAVGFSVSDSLPHRFDVETKPILEACEEVIREFSNLCVAMVCSAPQELAADLNDFGAVLTGEGAEMTNLKERISEALGINCIIADNHGTCGIRGLHKLIHTPDDYESCIMTTKTPVAWK